jgi:TolB-like protein
MNDASAAIAPGRPINLTREPDFSIAAVRVRPTACEVTAGGARVRLQPRVMQVLIALARANGQPVSRETLIEVCWGPLSVSEDALNRCIQRLRHLARGEAGVAFTIETIPKIGYRLTPDPAVERGTGAAATSLAPIGKPFVAVMPFANLTGDPEQDQFAAGMTEEITRSLSRVRTLFVVESDPNLFLKAKRFRPRNAARDRTGRYILQGSIHKARGRFRIAVKLVDTDGGLQLWTNGFDESAEDVFLLQDKVALSVAAAVEPAVVGAEVRWVLKHPSDNPGSYELYLRAQPHCTKRSLSEYLIAIDLFNRAIALDPNYRSALALAAHLHSDIAAYGWADDVDANRLRGIELAHRALIVDGDDAVVMAHAAHTIALLEGDLDVAAALLERAVALNPASSYTWFLSGLHQAHRGDPDIAITHLETSLRLDPRAHRSNSVGALATARYRQGRLDEAVALAREFVLKTDSLQGYACLAGSYAQLGQTSAAVAALTRYRALSTLPIEAFARSFLPYPAELKKFLDSLASAEAAAASSGNGELTACSDRP